MTHPDATPTPLPTHYETSQIVEVEAAPMPVYEWKLCYDPKTEEIGDCSVLRFKEKERKKP